MYENVRNNQKDMGHHGTSWDVGEDGIEVVTTT